MVEKKKRYLLTLVELLEVVSTETGNDIAPEKITDVLKKRGKKIPANKYNTKLTHKDIEFLSKEFKWSKDFTTKVLEFNKPKIEQQGKEQEIPEDTENETQEAEEINLDLDTEIDLDLDLDLDLEVDSSEDIVTEQPKIVKEKTDTDKQKTEATLEPIIIEQEEKDKEETEKQDTDINLKIVGKIDLFKTKPKKEKKEDKKEQKETPIETSVKVEKDKKQKTEEVTPSEKETEEELPEIQPAEGTEPETTVIVAESKEHLQETKPEIISKTEETTTSTETPEKNAAEEILSEEDLEKYKQLQEENPDAPIKIKGKIDLQKFKEKEKNLKERKIKERKERKQLAKELKEAKKAKQEKAEAKKTEQEAKRKRKRFQRRITKTTQTKQERQEDKRKRDAKARENIKETRKQINQKTKKQRQRARKEKRKQKQQKQLERIAAENKTIKLTEFITLGEFAALVGVPINQVIMKCMELGYMVNINHRMEKDLIEILAEEFGKEIEFIGVEEAFENEEETEVDESQLVPRPPVVTVMGHVDHGKTSLLDYIRKTNVVAGEAGGITQSIGAYSVTLEDGRRITFIDTPGHEDFSSMRARGAQVTDVVIIVVAADDEVKQQTEEALAHASNAGVPIVFAINKVDKPEVTPEKINKIKQQLAERGYLVEDWGGDYQCQEISAKTGQGIDELLEKVLLEAELLELKANPNAPAKGTVLEASLEPGKGPLANILVQNGTLRIGDPIIAGAQYGRVRVMFDERLRRVEEAGPSTPVQILGLKGVPEAGDPIRAAKSEKEAREIALKRQQILREQRLRKAQAYTLQALSEKAKGGQLDSLRIIVKADNRGSLEAITQSLLKLSTEEVSIDIVMASVGPVSESDVNLAYIANAIIVSFNARPTPRTRKLAEERGIEIRHYNIIYKLIEDIKQALSGLLKPSIEEKVLGTAEVRQVFRVPKVGTVAGCMVVEGVIKRNAKVRVVRNGVDIYDGEILGLKRFKDDVKEVPKGYECGISIKNFNDIKEGDLIEAYELVEVKRSLDDVKKLYDVN